MALDILKKKKANPFNRVAIPPEPDLNLEQETVALNTVIDSHNERTDSFETGQKMALQRLLRHYAAEFAKEAKYSEIKQRIDALKSTAKQKKENEKTISQEILEIEQRLSETVRAAESINNYLKGFFSKRDLKIKATTDSRFEVIRANQKAKNLSQGERTAISLSYFMAKLHERDVNLAATIVFLDDPISSLDSNHLFNTYSLIRNELADCKQLFVSTHSFEFLNLIKDWLGERAFKSKASFYLLECRESESRPNAFIINMPSLLLKFKSEYHYLFSILHNFMQGPADGHNLLYLLPNITRRLMEAFLSFKVPRHMGLEKKLETAIPEVIERHRILKFLHQYSHSASLPRSMYYPDLAECKTVIEKVLNMIRKMDPEHYAALVEEVDAQTASDGEEAEAS